MDISEMVLERYDDEAKCLIVARTPEEQKKLLESLAIDQAAVNERLRDADLLNH